MGLLSIACAALAFAAEAVVVDAGGAPPSMDPPSPPGESAGLGADELNQVLHLAALRLAGTSPRVYAQSETEEDLDGDGRVTSVRITRSIQRVGDDGTQHSEVEKAIEDGADVTQNVRRFRAEQEQKNRGHPANIDLDMELKVPFDGTQQARYLFNVAGESPGRLTVRFRPRFDPHRLWVGEATLESATGTILSLQGRPAQLPLFVDRIEVHMEFEPGWSTGPLAPRLVAEGRGHFLFFHKSMRYTSVVSPLPQTEAREESPALSR